MNETLSSEKKLNRLHLKLIACASMLADHVCRLFPDVLAASVISETVGRVAFPLFVYMLWQGFIYTKKRGRYLINLAVTAVISEIFYDLFFHGCIWYPGEQNTVFTLTLGLAMFIVLDKIKAKVQEYPEQKEGKRLSQTAMQLLCILTAAVFAAAAWAIRADYSLWGILACAVMYYTGMHAQPHISAAIACVPVLCGYMTPGVFLALIPLYFYGAGKMRIPAVAKYAFYFFYPAHLALLWILFR